MNNTLKILLLSVSGVAIIGGAYLLYNRLSANFETGISSTVSNTNGEESTASQEYVLEKDFTVYDQNGKVVKLSSFEGKPVVVNFWASWCGPCRTEMPHFQDMYEKYQDDVNVMMVNLSGGGNDTREDARTLLKNGSYTFPVYFDDNNSAAIAYSIRSIPATYVFNEYGELVDYTVGTLSKSKLERLIKKIL